MPLSERTEDVRARTHIADGPWSGRPTSTNAASRPPLRVVPPPAHNENPPQSPAGDHGQQSHLKDAVRAATAHPVTATHPPTLSEAMENLWPDRDEVRHGLAGQLLAAAAGLVQLLGLAACWGTAHVFFASKTRSAIFLLVLIAAGATWAVASHA